MNADSPRAHGRHHCFLQLGTHMDETLMAYDVVSNLVPTAGACHRQAPEDLPPAAQGPGQRTQDRSSPVRIRSAEHGVMSSRASDTPRHAAWSGCVHRFCRISAWLVRDCRAEHPSVIYESDDPPQAQDASVERPGHGGRSRGDDRDDAAAEGNGERGGAHTGGDLYAAPVRDVGAAASGESAMLRLAFRRRQGKVRAGPRVLLRLP